MRNMSIDKDKKKTNNIVTSLEQNLRNQNNSRKILVTDTADAYISKENLQGEDLTPKTN